MKGHMAAWACCASMVLLGTDKRFGRCEDGRIGLDPQCHRFVLEDHPPPHKTHFPKMRPTPSVVTIPFIGPVDLEVTQKGMKWGVLGAITMTLALDFYLHESPSHIKRHMRSLLLACKPPNCPPPMHPHFIPPQSPLLLGFTPTLVQGPSGCGKGLALSTIVPSLARPTPNLLARIHPLPVRNGDRRGLGSVAVPSPEALPVWDLERQIFPQIGFPTRRSLIGGLLYAYSLWEGRDPRARIATSFRLLFEACEEVKVEREKTMDPLEAAPVLMFDLFHENMDRVRYSTGKVVLEVLGALIKEYCEEKKAVRVAVTGSSADLYFAFLDNPSTAGPAHWCVYDVKDPEQGVVTAALVSKGYSPKDARSMVDLCGTRLRLLESPLTLGALHYYAADFLIAQHALGRAALANVFHKLSRVEATQLGGVMDSIEMCEAAAPGGSSEAPQRPTKWMLPESLRQANVSDLLYYGTDERLFFQSILHRGAWREERLKYVA